MSAPGPAEAIAAITACAVSADLAEGLDAEELAAAYADEHLLVTIAYIPPPNRLATIKRRIKALGGTGAASSSAASAAAVEPALLERFERLEMKIDSMRPTHRGGSMSYSEYAHAWAPQPVQSFFLQLRSPGGSNVRLFKDLAQPACTQEAVLQTAWSTLSLPQSIDKQPTTLRLHDTHKNAFLDGRKPDLTFSAPQHLPTPFSAVVLAELTIDDFSPSKEGELLSCVHRALEIQVFRHTMLSFLAGRSQIRFFRTRVLSRDALTGSIQVEHLRYGPLELDGGQASGALGGLFTASLSELGWQPPVLVIPPSAGGLPSAQDVVVTDLLGSGVTSDVYRIALPTGVMAAKVLRSRSCRTHAQLIDDCRREQETYVKMAAADVKNVLRVHAILECARGGTGGGSSAAAAGRSTASSSTQSSSPAMSSPLPRIPEVVTGESLQSPALLLSPVCCRFRSLRADMSAPLLLGSHLHQLVGALEGMHRAGFLHRDVRPENIGCSEEDKELYLLDAGFAVPLGGEARPWEGTLRYASPRVLLSLATPSPQPLCATAADDLHSLIRCCYALLHPHLTLELKQWSVSDASAIASFWQQRLASGVWLQMTNLCEQEQQAPAALAAACAHLPSAGVYSQLRAFLASVL